MVAVATRSADDVELVRRATEAAGGDGGDGEAFTELFDRWFDRAYDVAWHIVRNRDTAAEAAQEAFTIAWEGLGSLRRPESFGGWVLRITRNEALQRLAAEQRTRPVGDDEEIAAHDGRRRSAGDPADPITDRERDDLVWAAAAALGDDDASILHLHLRHGLAAGELADELGIAPNAAHQRLFRLRKRLGDAIGAWTLWRSGRPRCGDLRRVLAAAGVTRFDREAAAVITDHTRRCADCDERRSLRLSPEALFAATPLVAAAPAVKARAGAALAASGMPAPAPMGLAPSGSRIGRWVAAGTAVAAAMGLAAILLTGRGSRYEPPGSTDQLPAASGAAPGPASPTDVVAPGAAPARVPRPAPTSSASTICSTPAPSPPPSSCVDQPPAQPEPGG